jgi:hypothetical protein
MKSFSLLEIMKYGGSLWHEPDTTFHGNQSTEMMGHTDRDTDTYKDYYED